MNNDLRHLYQSQNQNQRNLASHLEEQDNQEIEIQNEDDMNAEFEEQAPQDSEELVGQDIYRKISENALAYNPAEQVDYYYDDPINYNKIMEKYGRSGNYEAKNAPEYTKKIQEYERQVHQGKTSC